MFHYRDFGCFPPPERAGPHRRLYRKRYGLLQVVRSRCELSFPVIFCLFLLSAVRKSFSHPLVNESAHVEQSKERNQTQNWAAEARNRLAKQRGKKPETTAGQIWALWPDIKNALAEGQRIRSIRQLLEEHAGIVVTTASLTTYISRCRRKEIRTPRMPVSAESSPDGANIAHHPISADDPMAGAREALSRPRFDIRKLHGDGDPTDRKLI